MFGAVVRPSCRVWSSGPAVCFRPLGLFHSVCSQKRSRPRAPTQGRVLRRGDDPSTDLQAGFPKYVRFTSTWDHLLGSILLFFPFLSSRAGSPWRSLRTLSGFRRSACLSSGSRVRANGEPCDEKRCCVPQLMATSSTSSHHSSQFSSGVGTWSMPGAVLVQLAWLA